MIRWWARLRRPRDDVYNSRTGTTVMVRQLMDPKYMPPPMGTGRPHPDQEIPIMEPMDLPLAIVELEAMCEDINNLPFEDMLVHGIRAVRLETLQDAINRLRSVLPAPSEDSAALRAQVAELTAHRQALTELAGTAIEWQSWEPECGELAAWHEKFAQHRAPEPDEGAAS